MTTHINVASQNAACDAIVDRIDLGAGAGYIQIRSGGPPANPAAANTGTLLATLTFSDPAFGASGAVNPGEAIAAAITSDTNADNDGVAGHFRVFDSNNVCIFQGTCGEAADSPDMEFNDKDIVQGGIVAVTAMTLTVPAS